MLTVQWYIIKKINVSEYILPIHHADVIQSKLEWNATNNCTMSPLQVRAYSNQIQIAQGRNI